MNDLSVSDKVRLILGSNAQFSDEQEAIIEEMIEHAISRPSGRYGNHRDHPSGYTMLCIHALVEHIERLEDAEKRRQERLREFYVELTTAAIKGDVRRDLTGKLAEALMDEERPVY